MNPTRIAALLAAAPLACLAADEPLWEAGMGVAAVYLPDYRGSDHSRGYALPSNSASKPASSRIGTPSCSAFVNFEPGLSPTTT